MTLTVGARLGPYEVQAAIGAGGMGEVYRARDTRLDRTVAIKLLSASFADRPDRRRRFHAEARAISSLQHPHICTLFDVGDQDGQAFLVMEYLEGETLDDRLTRGPLPGRDVLLYASQIAGALDHAHRAHIVHRDLKPSNVMLTQSGAKLLDFGLARGPRPGATTSSTVSSPPDTLTAEGTLVGTFQYMAPEQLEGGSADERTDIFAFGTLLFEIATGRRAFEGNSQASLIAAILTAQPPSVSSTRAARRTDGLPDALDHIVERCLAKVPDNRWQTARDLKAEIDWLLENGSGAGKRLAPARRFHREWIAWVAATVATLLAAFLVVRGDRPQPLELTRFGVALPPRSSIPRSTGDQTYLAVSPDGRHLAFLADTEGIRRMWVQSFDSSAPRLLEGVNEPISPFWSPDSRFIGYFSRAERQLKKVELSGGPSRTICQAYVTGLPVWLADGTILFTEFRKGLYRVSAEGGEPAQVTRVDPSQGELNHFWPSMLPDGRRFLYMATRLDASGVRATPIVYAATFDSPDRHEILRVSSRMVFRPPGRVLYVHEGALMAQTFDTDTLRLVGEPVQVLENLDYGSSTGTATFSLSDTGVLAFYRSSDAFSLLWFDRTGRELGAVGTPRPFGPLRIARDGERVAVEVADPRLGSIDIWGYDLTRGVATRLTDDLNSERLPVWSPDGERIAFVSDRGTGSDASGDFFDKRADGMGNEQPFFVQVGPQFLDDWSSDGRFVVYRDENRETADDIWILPMTGERKPWPFQRTRFAEWGARFSPDSSWLAFSSNESGQNQVYLAPVAGPGAKRQVSIDGGASPRWRRDGKELYFLSSDGRSVMALPIVLAPSPRFGTPERLFTIDRSRVFPGTVRNIPYDVAPDGQRFLFILSAGEQTAPEISVIVNWPALLDR